MFTNPPTLNGMKIVVSHLIQPIPVLSLDERFKWCSDAFRSEMNAWLLDMFGTREYALMVGDSLLVSPKQLALLKL